MQQRFEVARPAGVPVAVTCTRAAAIALLIFAWCISGSGADAGKLFSKNCAPCHSNDGRAQTPMAKKLGVKDLSLSKASDEQIALRIKEGKLPGEKASKMPAYKDKLTQQEIDALVSKVKSFRKK